MDGTYTSTGKRPFTDNGVDRNGRQKRRNSSSDQPASVITEYRILCPGSKIGSIIGKGGNVIKSFRQETRAKINVEDPVPGSDERIIYIFSSSKGRSDDDKAGEKEGVVCPAQEALFRVHNKIVDLEGGGSEEDDDEPPKPVSARLLVPNSQIGSLLGKGGKVIEQMRKDSGAQIRILPKNQLPACATPNDELVQVSGDRAPVRKALQAVSAKLHENPPRERSQGGTLSQGPTIPSGNSLVPAGSLLPSGGSLLAQATVAGGPIMGLGHSLPPLGMRGTTAVSNWRLGSSYPGLAATASLAPRAESGPVEEFVVRVICPNDKIGSMIGKGGNVIRKMREDTGAKIKVGDPITNSDERILEITCNEYLESPTSPCIDAALQVQKRLADLMSDKDNDVETITIRLLVPSNQIGCLLGKGGSIINEMRKTTKANIRIPPKEELPTCAGENDELVQIAGEFNMVEHALVQVLTRLRNNLFKGHGVGTGSGLGVLPSLSGIPLQGTTPSLPGYGARLDSSGSPGRMYSLTGGLGFQGIGQPTGYGSYGSPVAVTGRKQRTAKRKQK
eukprot:c27596_g1_i3 orf=979-2661(+)